MGNLLRFNISNLFKQKLFYICTILTLLSSAIEPIIYSFSKKGTSYLAFPEIISFLTTEVGIITTIFVTLFVIFDFSEGTTKNIISRGYTRKELFLSKYITAVIAVFLIDFIVSFLLFIFLAKNGIGFESNMIYKLIGYIFVVFGQVAFFTSIAYMLEKTGAALVANILIPMFMPLILLFIEAKIKINLSSYWLTEANTILAKKTITFSSTIHCVTLSICYMVVFLALAILITAKKEIK